MSDSEFVLVVSYSTRSDSVKQRLPESSVTQLFLDRQQGLLHFRAQTESTRLASDVVATIVVQGFLLIFEPFVGGVFVESAAGGSSRVELDRSLNTSRARAFLGEAQTVHIDQFGTSVAITRILQQPSHDSNPSAADTDTVSMPPLLIAESQGEEDIEVPTQPITGPDDETDEEQEPEIPPTPDAARPQEVAAEAAERSLSTGSAKKRQARDANEEEFEEPPKKKTHLSPSPADDDKTSNPDSIAQEPPRRRWTSTARTAEDPPQAERQDSREDPAAPMETGNTEEPMADAFSDDEIVVARPSVESKRSRQSRSSLAPSSTPTPRSASTRSQSSPFMSRPKPTVLFSGLDLDSDTLRWVKKQGVIVPEKVPGARANYLCVVKEDRGRDVRSLPTTLKVLKALLAQKLIVSEAWILDSKDEGELLDPDDYVVEDGRDRSRSALFSGKTVYFTRQAAKTSDIKVLARDAGAARVESGTPAKGLSLTPKGSVILLADENDEDAAELVEEGRVVYERALLTQSILRGELDLESDEFRLS